MKKPIVDLKIKDSKEDHLIITDYVKNLTLPKAISYLKAKYGAKEEPKKTKTLLQQLEEEERENNNNFMQQ